MTGVNIQGMPVPDMFVFAEVEETFRRITEEGDLRITEEGDQRVTE